MSAAGLLMLFICSPVPYAHAQERLNVSPLVSHGTTVTEVCDKLLQSDPMAVACPKQGAIDRPCLRVVEGKEEFLVRCEGGKDVPGFCTTRDAGSRKGTRKIRYPAVYRTNVVPVEDAVRTLQLKEGARLAVVAREIARQKYVEYVELNCQYEVVESDDVEMVELPAAAQAACDCAGDAQGSDPIFDSGKQWALAAISASSAWPHILNTDNEVIVGVLDSGVSFGHEDFWAQDDNESSMWRNEDEIPDGVKFEDGGDQKDDPSGNGNGYIDDMYGHAFVPSKCRDPDDPQEGCQPYDLFGHGTSVAGIIGAQADNGRGIVGVHYGAKIMALRARHSLDTAVGVLPDYLGFAEAIHYGQENYASVVNISLMVPTGAGSGVIATTITEALEDMLVVIAAGNGHSPLCERDPDNVFLLDKQDNMMIVMATNRYQRGDETVTREVWSNFGDCLVDIAAPGQCICTTKSSDAGTDYRSWGQTSAATPIVSGAAAILMSLPEFQYCPPHEIREILVENALSIEVGDSDTSNRADGTVDLAFLENIGSIRGHNCVSVPPNE